MTPKFKNSIKSPTNKWQNYKYLLKFSFNTQIKNRLRRKKICNDRGDSNIGHIRFRVAEDYQKGGL